MAIARVNKLGTVNNTGTGLSSLSLTVTATTTAHNRIIVAAWWGAANPTVTVTDSQGNNYSVDKAMTASAAAGWGGVFSARADNPLTINVDTITVTWSGGTVNDAMMAAYEYSGLANFAPLDQAVSAGGAGNSAASGSATTQFANELIFGAIGYNSGTLSVPSYTQLDLIAGNLHHLETQEDIVAATGSYNVTATISGGGVDWASALVSYADTANGTAHQPSNSTAPAITGSGVVGMQLTCSQGSWTNTPTAYAYQWERAGVNITGATGAHYPVTTTDVGNALSCVVTASNKYGSVAATASNTVTPSVNKIESGLGI